MFTEQVTSAAISTFQSEVSFGSIVPEHDRVSAWVDTSAIANVKSKISWRIYVTQSGITTMVKEFGPFSSDLAPFLAGTISAIPGASYELKGIVLSGSVSAVAIKAGITGFDNQADTALDASVATHTLTQADQLFSTLAAYHTKYQARLDFNGATHPASRWRLYATVTGTGGTIKALVKEYALNAPPPGGTMAIDLSNIGAQLWQLYGASTDGVATGSLAPTVDAVLIGFDETINGGGLVTAAALAQTAWHINPLIGNNAWDGTAAANVVGSSVGPIATFAEYIKRTGLNRPIAIAVTIFIEADLPATDPVIVTGIPTTSLGTINVTGSSLTVLATGTLTGYTAPVAAANTLPDITDALVATWTPYAGKLLRMTSGAHSADGGAMWIIKDLGGNKARVANPSYRSGSINVLNFIPAGTETYEIVSPRVLGGGLFVDVQPGTNLTSTYVGVNLISASIAGPLNYLFAGVIGFSCLFPLLLLGPNNTFLNCQFGSTFSVYSGYQTMVGCYFNATTLALSSSCVVAMGVVPCAIRAGSCQISSQSMVDVLVQGPSGAVGSIQIADTTNYWRLSKGGFLSVAGDIYGSVDAATMYAVGTSCRMQVASPTNLRIGGTTFDIKVAGKSQIFPIVAATGLPAGAVQTCSLALFADPAQFAGNIHDPLTGTSVLTTA